VNVGRATVAVALIIAILIAPQLGNLGQVFQYIQEYTGVVSPGILAVFLTGLFWRKATNNAAIWGVVLSIPIAMYFKIGPNGWLDGTTLAPLFLTLPFLQQMLFTCLLCIGIILLVSQLEGKGKPDPKGIELSRSLFATSPTFNIGAAVVGVILAVLYALFW
jgi:SSS family solute:Na+ symporter